MTKKYESYDVNDLIVLAKNNDLAAKAEITNRYINLINKTAHKYMDKVPFEDLVHEGICGLYDAINRFDISREVKFITYAHNYILGRILDSIKMETTIRMPESLYVRVREYEEKYRDFVNSNLRSPSYSEMKSNMRYSHEDMRYIISFPVTVSNYQSNGDEVINVYDFIPSSYLLEEDAINSVFSKELNDVFKYLSDIEKDILKYRYGLFGNECLTYEEIACALGSSITSVRRMEKNALSKLRGFLNLDEKKLVR